MNVKKVFRMSENRKFKLEFDSENDQWYCLPTDMIKEFLLKLNYSHINKSLEAYYLLNLRFDKYKIRCPQSIIIENPIQETSEFYKDVLSGKVLVDETISDKTNKEK